MKSESVVVTPGQEAPWALKSGPCVQAKVETIEEGKVVCGEPGGTPLTPLMKSAETIERLAMPTGVAGFGQGVPFACTGPESQPLVFGNLLGRAEWVPVGTREFARSVQPYLGATAARPMLIAPSPAAAQFPERVGERHPGEAGSVGAAGGDHVRRVDVGKRRIGVEKLGDLAGKVLEVVDLVVAGVELRLPGRAAVLSVDEAARRVVEHHVAAAREPRVVVVPPLSRGVEARASRVGGLPARLASRAATVHEDEQRARPGEVGRVRVGDVDVEGDVAARVSTGVGRGAGARRKAGVPVAAVGRGHGDGAGAGQVREGAAGVRDSVVTEEVVLGCGRVLRAARRQGQRRRDRRRGWGGSNQYAGQRRRDGDCFCPDSDRRSLHPLLPVDPRRTLLMPPRRGAGDRRAADEWTGRYGAGGATSTGSPPRIQCASGEGGVSRKNHSASRAPMQPVPAAVTA